MTTRHTMMLWWCSGERAEAGLVTAGAGGRHCQPLFLSLSLSLYSVSPRCRRPLPMNAARSCSRHSHGSCAPATPSSPRVGSEHMSRASHALFSGWRPLVRLCICPCLCLNLCVCLSLVWTQLEAGLSNLCLTSSGLGSCVFSLVCSLDGSPMATWNMGVSHKSARTNCPVEATAATKHGLKFRQFDADAHTVGFLPTAVGSSSVCCITLLVPAS